MLARARARYAKRRYVQLALEALESRLTPARPAPLIRLDLVALHEIGHALGLDHSNNPNSIMYPYINNNYDLNYFDSGSDPAVAALQSLYSPSRIADSATPWQDDLDGADDGVVALTYSFPGDGTKLEQGNKYNNFAQTFGASLTAAREIIVAQLDRWASASEGRLTFTPHTDNNQAFSVSGLSQNDPRIGDIRFASHKFDSPGGVIGHAYFAPDVNSGTIAGDVHFASEEKWVLISSSGAAFSGPGSASSGGSSGSNLTLGIGSGGNESTQSVSAVLIPAPAPVNVTVVTTVAANPGARFNSPVALAVFAQQSASPRPQLIASGGSDGVVPHDIRISVEIALPQAARKGTDRIRQSSVTPALQERGPSPTALRTFPVLLVDAVFADEYRRGAGWPAALPSTPQLADGATGTQTPLAAVVGLALFLAGDRGCRVIDRRERVAQLRGTWRDTILTE